MSLRRFFSDLISNKGKLLLSILIVLILLTAVAWFSCESWRFDLVAEGLGAVITVGVISLIFYSWSKSKWKPICEKVKQGITVRVGFMVHSTYSLLEGTKVAGRLVLSLKKISFDEMEKEILEKYEEKVNAFSFPGELSNIKGFFENYGKTWNLFFTEFKEYLHPEMINIMMEIKDLLFKAQFTLEQDSKYYDMVDESEDIEDYNNSLKETLKEYIVKLMSHVDNINELLEKGIILRDYI